MPSGTTDRAVVETPPGGRDGIVRQLPSFAVIGVTSTVAYLVLYALLREVIAPYAANTVALAVTAIANTAANRRFTFDVRDAGTADRLAHQAKGGVAFLIGLALTNGALLVLHSVSRSPRHTVEIAVLIVANLLATASRFLLMRVWVFKTA